MVARRQPDSNDTAAAIQALRAAGGPAARRCGVRVVALRAFQNRDGGFALTKGRESDAQSTAWAIQALISAGEKPGKPPFRYLSRLRRADGSYRYSVRYGDDAGLGHGAGAAGARRQAVPAALTRTRATSLLRSVSSSVVDERAPQRARDRGGGGGPSGAGSPVVAVVVVGFLLAAIVGMASADSPWLSGDGSRSSPPAIVGQVLAVALAAGLCILLGVIWIRHASTPQGEAEARRPRDRHRRARVEPAGGLPRPGRWDARDRRARDRVLVPARAGGPGPAAAAPAAATIGTTGVLPRAGAAPRPRHRPSTGSSSGWSPRSRSSCPSRSSPAAGFG